MQELRRTRQLAIGVVGLWVAFLPIWLRAGIGEIVVSAVAQAWLSASLVRSRVAWAKALGWVSLLLLVLLVVVASVLLGRILRTYLYEPSM